MLGLWRKLMGWSRLRGVCVQLLCGREKDSSPMLVDSPKPSHFGLVLSSPFGPVFTFCIFFRLEKYGRVCVVELHIMPDPLLYILW